MQTASKRSQFLSIAQLAVSGLGLLSFLGTAIGMLALGVGMLMNGGSKVLQTSSFFSLAWIGLFFGILMIPSTLLALYQLMGKQDPAWRLGGFRTSSVLMLLWPLVLLLGSLAAPRQTLNWLVLPPLQVLAVAIPLWWLVEVGGRGIPAGSRQRRWGLLNFGLVITSALAVLVEMIFILAVGALAVAWLASLPDGAALLQRTSARLLNSNMNAEIVARVFRPFLRQPVVVFGIFSVGAGLIPLIEELLKPLALWALFSRRLTPAEGFTAGLVCGGAFALLESLGALIAPNPGGWAALVIGRFGAGLLHVVTTGLMGWGLASAWSEGRYTRLGAVYLLAVSLHALWNTFGLLMGLSPIAPPGLMAQLGQAAPYALGVLIAAMLLLLVGANQRLRQQIPVPSPESGTVG